MQRMVGVRQYGTGPGWGSVELGSGGRSSVQARFGTEAGAGAALSPAATAKSAQATPTLNLLAMN